MVNSMSGVRKTNSNCQKIFRQTNLSDLHNRKLIGISILTHCFRHIVMRKLCMLLEYANDKARHNIDMVCVSPASAINKLYHPRQLPIVEFERFSSLYFFFIFFL